MRATVSRGSFPPARVASNDVTCHISGVPSAVTRPVHWGLPLVDGRGRGAGAVLHLQALLTKLHSTHFEIPLTLVID